MNKNVLKSFYFWTPKSCLPANFRKKRLHEAAKWQSTRERKIPNLFLKANLIALKIRLCLKLNSNGSILNTSMFE